MHVAPLHRSAAARTAVTVLALLVMTAHACGLEVTIITPADGAVVSGSLSIQGTSQDVAPGVVSVSIDGGPFIPAQGLESWSFSLDTMTLTGGLHTITARARQCIGCPAVFDSIGIQIDNDGLSVSIITPADGTEITGTLVVTGTSSQASAVALQVDAGPFQTANGLDPWNVVIEDGALAPGPHTLTARATASDGSTVFASVDVTAGDIGSGLQNVTYVSSIDGEPLAMKLYVPASFDADAAEIGLICHLHGGGGVGNVNATLQAGADERNWIVIAPDGRQWPLADPAQCPNNPNAAGGCAWCTSAAYVDNPVDPAVGPGEQDILDAIDWASAMFNIDPARVYLTGFSMGGRGTYIIGLRHPDRFAAIGPLAPAIDMYEVFVRRPEPAACKAGMVGGEPGDTTFTDTMYSITSGRFLIENAFNLPVYHAHGTLDTVANNDPGHAPFLHGRHILMDETWDGCHGATDLCFGHTPTLSELRARHPDGYDWAFMFTPVGHNADAQWMTGAAAGPGLEGVADDDTPGNLLGMFEFFDEHVLVTDPDTIVYKSYTDTHRKAYWAAIDVATPWSDLPGAIRATRNPTENRLDLELSRVATATIDMEDAGLALAAGLPLTVLIDRLDEPVFDPALTDTGQTLEPTLVLTGDFAAIAEVVVIRDGAALPTRLVDVGPFDLTVGPLDITGPTTLTITPLQPADVTGDGLVNIDDLVSVILAWGPCPAAPAACPADIDESGTVDVDDLVTVLTSWS